MGYYCSVHNCDDQSHLHSNEMTMANRRKVLIFHSWLNLAMKDFIMNLGLFNLLVSAIPLSKLCGQEQVHDPTGEWAEQNGGGKRAQILRLP